VFTPEDWLSGDMPPPPKSPVRTVSRQPVRMTSREVVEQLGLVVGTIITCADGIARPIKRITGDGEVHVKGVNGKINVHALL